VKGKRGGRGVDLSHLVRQSSPKDKLVTLWKYKSRLKRGETERERGTEKKKKQKKHYRPEPRTPGVTEGSTTTVFSYEPL